VPETIEPVDAGADTRGIVDPAAGFERFVLTRHDPSPALGWTVERYWGVRWDLPAGEHYDQRILYHPACNLVFEAGTAEVEPVSTGDFVRRLEGRGWVLGVKFLPAGFRPWLGRPVSTVAGRRLAARDAFGPAIDDLAADVAAHDDPAAAVGLVDEALATWPNVSPLPMTRPMNALVAHMADDRTITRVDGLADRLGVGTRRLQRLFADHVGVSPKWVINRFRLHEAAERAGGGEPVDWAGLAADLGYSDQAHLVREFRAAIGAPPERYSARQTT
jgi:AraC-like DNA-binding protein